MAAMESLAGAMNRVGNAILTGLAALAMAASPIDEGAAVVAAGRGLRGASSGLKGLFKAEGELAEGTLIGVRTRLLGDGFSQTLSNNRKGHLFTNDAGEQVMLMSGENGWTLRVRNSAGNHYLDEMGNPGDRASTHLSISNR